MAIAHDTSTRFPAGDPATNLSNTSGTTGDVSFTHTPSGTPAGVVIVMFTGDSTGTPCTGITYGGIAMTFYGTFTDTSETGSVSIWYLTGVAIPTGAQTVVLQGRVGVGIFLTCSTVTSSTGYSALAGSAGRNHVLGAGTVSITTSIQAMLYGGIHSGQAAVASCVPIAGYTQQNHNDYGLKVALSSRSSSPMAAGTFDYGFSQGSDDNCIGVVALGEADAPPATHHPRSPAIVFQDPALV